MARFTVVTSARRLLRLDCDLEVLITLRSSHYLLSLLSTSLLLLHGLLDRRYVDSTLF